MEFEQIVISALSDLYPDCHVFQFKPTISYNGEGWQPDLAVVAKDYSYWFVIEVEIARHSLEKHVLPQVRAFRMGDYGDAACKALAKALRISPDQADTLIKFVPRSVAVITNHEDQDWTKALAAENAQLITMASYEGPGFDRKALFIEGSLTTPQFSRGFGRVLATSQVVVLPLSSFWKESEYRITDPSGCGNWTARIEEGKVWLTKKKGLIQIPDGCLVHLVEQIDLIEMRPLLR